MDHQIAGDLNAHPDFYTPLNQYKPADPYYRTVLALLPARWRIKRSHFWTQAVSPRDSGPVQGWKIHVSSTLENAYKTLERVSTACFDAGVEFKFASDEYIHRKLVSKNIPRQSGGKFMTIYPPTVAVFESLLEVLYDRMAGLEAPYILSDRQYRDSSSIFYRYGGFKAMPSRDYRGREKSMILDPSFQYIEDQRVPHFRLPDFVLDGRWGMSTIADEPEAAEQATELFGGKYEILDVLKFSNAGGVYSGRRRSDGAPVVIKEARPHVGADTAGIDVLTRLRKEMRLLKALSGTGIAPEALDWYEEWEHSFLVQEHVAGVGLRQYSVAETRIIHPGASVEEVRIWLGNVVAIARDALGKINTLHQRGVVFGDVSSNNLILDKDALSSRFIDFEGAYEAGVDEPINIYTPGFGRPGRRRADAPVVADDAYAMGALILAMLAPSHLMVELSDTYAQHLLEELGADIGLPSELAHAVLVLLKAEADAVESALAALHRVDLSTVKGFSAQVECCASDVSAEQAQAVAGYFERLLDLRHAWRPLPLGPSATSLDSPEFGLPGVALSWQQIRGRVPEALQKRIAEAGQGERDLAGLYNGSSGVSWIQADLGLLPQARETLRRAGNNSLLYQGFSLAYGCAGYGLACLKLWLKTGETEYLHSAEHVAGVLMQEASEEDSGIYWHDGGDRPVPIGLAEGASGIALFLTYLFKATADERYLHAARRALEFDISKGRKVHGALGFPTDISPSSRILYPYLAYGSAGVASVALRVFAVTGDEQYLHFLNDVKSGVSQKFTMSAEMSMGLAGIATYLLDAAQILGAEEYRGLAQRAANGLQMFKVQRKEGLCYPSGTTGKLSCGLVDGAAGIAMFLDRLAHDKPNNFFMLDELLEIDP